MAAKKQLKIPGTEGKAIKEVNDAAEHYVSMRDKRMKLTEKEVEAQTALLAAMKKHNVEVYRDDDASPPLVCTLVPGKDKVKVQKADEEDDAGAGGSE